MEFLKEKADRIWACIVGGAAGDCLGTPVEFMSRERILETYGDRGITELPVHNEVSPASDDTQMTYLTFKALGEGPAESFMERLLEEYCRWAEAQDRQLSPDDYVDSTGNPKFLTEVRAPGLTCLTALLRHKGKQGLRDPFNNSKGCGGVMRVAPIGFLDVDPEEAAYLSVQASGCTHGHPLGYLASAAYTALIYRFIRRNDEPVSELYTMAMNDVEDMLAHQENEFPGSARKYWEELRDLLDEVMQYADGGPCAEYEADIGIWGEGWVAEETLAMALYSAVRHDDLDGCIIESANITGDSDSVASVAGGLVCALHGRKALERTQLDLSRLESLPEFRLLFDRYLS